MARKQEQGQVRRPAEVMREGGNKSGLKTELETIETAQQNELEKDTPQP